MRNMLDIAGGILIASVLIGLVGLGWKLSVVDHNPSIGVALAPMIVPFLIAIWIVFLRGVLPLPF